MKSVSGTTHTATPANLFGGYKLADGAYDEMATGPGMLRAHCEGLVRSLESLGRDELAARWEGARRSIRDNGVTYNVYGDPQGMDRPWELDMIPFLIAPAEGSGLEAGVRQRGRFINLNFGGLYRARRLIRWEILPAAPGVCKPGFVRP